MPPPPPPPPPPEPPVQVGSIPAQVINVGESAEIDVASYFRDPDGGALTYAAATSAPRVVSVGISGSSLTIVGVSEGTATVTVTATDPGGLTASQSTGVTVERPNLPPAPVGSMPARSVEVGQTLTLGVAQYFSDPDGDPLEYAAATSAAGIVSVSISDSTLTMVGVSEGTATVTVTATDTEGLTGAQIIQVSVTEPVGGFREDFDDPASLADWDIQDAVAAVPAADSVLELTNRTTGRLGTAERRSPPSLRAWELSAEISRVSSGATPGVIWFTTHSRFFAVRLLLPMSTDMNYRFSIFDGAQSAWLTVTNLSGHSGSISAAPNAYDQIRLAHETTDADFFVFEAGAPGGSNEIFRVSLDLTLSGVRLGDILDGLVDIWLVNSGAVDVTALFDWVEVSGEEISTDAASGADAASAVDTAHAVDRVRALADAPAANRVRLGRAPSRPQ